jgi:hypothetical protein
MNDMLTLGDVADRLQVSLSLVRKLARAAELAAEALAVNGWLDGEGGAAFGEDEDWRLVAVDEPGDDED